jgi:CBS domain-containing protein
MRRIVSSIMVALPRFSVCSSSTTTSHTRSFIFPRGVETSKGAFVGNFPSKASEFDPNVFYNQVPYLSPDTTIVEASLMLQKYDLGCVPVLNSSKALVGMISERDISRAFGTFHRDGVPKSSGSLNEDPSNNNPTTTATTDTASVSDVASTSTASSGDPAFTSPSSSPQQYRHVDLRDVRVHEIMSRNVIRIVEGTSLSEALMIMDLNNFRHLPVVAANNDTVVVGLLSMRDIMHKHVKGETQATTADFMRWVLKMSS